MEAIVQQKEKALTPFAPENLEQAMKLCDLLSKSSLVPAPLRGKPSDIFVVLATGRELGIGPMQALSDINVIQGKPVYSADLMVSQCKRRSDVCQYIRVVESTDSVATYETQRVGSPSPEKFTFSIEDARRLGLAEKDNYRKQPRTMLRRRAAAQLAREVYPDLVRGYDPDEAADFASPVKALPQPGPTTTDAPASVTPTPAFQSEACRVVAALAPEPDATTRAAEAIVEQVEAVTAQSIPDHVKPLFEQLLRQAEPKGPNGTHTAEQVAYSMKLLGDAAGAILPPNLPMADWSPGMVRTLERHFFPQSKRPHP